MKRWTTWVLAVGGLLAVVFGAPYGVEWYADRAASRRAEAGPGELEWESVDWFWTGVFRFTGVRGAGGPVEKFRVERLDVVLDAGDLLTATPTVRGLRARGVRMRVDGSGRTRSGSAKSGEPKRGEDSSGRLEELASELRHVAVRDATVEIRRSGLPAATLEGRATLAKGRDLEGRGTVRLGRSDAERAYGWRLAGRANLGARSVAGRIDLREAGSDEDSNGRVSLTYSPFRIAADAVRFRVGEFANRGSAAVAIDGVSTALSGRRGPAFRLSGPELDIVRERDGGLHLTGESLRVLLAPERIIKLVRSRTGASSDGGEDGEGSGLDRSALLSYARSELDVSFGGTALELVVKDDAGWKSYRPTRDLTIRKRGLRVAASGEFAAGSAAATAQFEPGHLIPASAGFRLDGVRLGEMPVVRKGRSLPSRGVRGELGGRVDAAGTLVREGLRGSLLERLTGRLELDWSDGRVRADGLAPKPVRGIDLTLDVAVDWEPGLSRLRLMESRLTFGPMTVDFRGSVVDWPIDPQVWFRAELHKIACQKAVRSLPDTLLGPYRDIAIEGKVAPVFTFDFPVDHPKKLSIGLDGFPGACRPTALNARKPGWPDLEFARHAATAMRDVPTASRTATRQYAAAPEPANPIEAPDDLVPIPSTWTPNRPDDVFWLREPFIKRVTEGVSKGAEVRVGPGLLSYVPLEAMPPHVAGSAYLSEEINFYSDGGWNLRLIEKALQLDFQEERFVYGGSTVTQQLVKNLFLTRRKTLDRKIQEALIAWRMQGVVSKDRVLELYLNCIEFGEDVYGIGPAARHYFQKEAENLTPLEGVFLAVIKPAPWFGDRFVDDGSTPKSGWWRDRIREIMERLVQKGFISEKRAEKAKPYVLKWDDEGNYLPDAPEKAGGSKKGADGTSDKETETTSE